MSDVAREGEELRHRRELRERLAREQEHIRRIRVGLSRMRRTVRLGRYQSRRLNGAASAMVTGPDGSVDTDAGAGAYRLSLSTDSRRLVSFVEGVGTTDNVVTGEEVKLPKSKSRRAGEDVTILESGESATYSSESPEAWKDAGSFRLYQTSPILSDLYWKPDTEASNCFREIEGLETERRQLLDESVDIASETWIDTLAREVGINASTDLSLSAEPMTYRFQSELCGSRAVVEIPMGLRSDVGASCCVCQSTLSELSAVSLRLLSVAPCGHLLCQDCYATLFGMKLDDDRVPSRIGQPRLDVDAGEIICETCRRTVLCPHCRVSLMQEEAEVRRVLNLICTERLQVRLKIYQKALQKSQFRAEKYRDGYRYSRERADHAERSCRYIVSRDGMTRRARTAMLVKTTLPPISGAGACPDKKRKTTDASTCSRRDRKRRRKRAVTVAVASSSSSDETDIGQN